VTARAAQQARCGGFTLLEVMVALVIVALGMSALLEALSVSAGNISALRDKTVAEWVAMNKIADARLALKPPPLGMTEGDIADCAHGTWHWRQDVSAVTAIPGLINITVSVRRTGNSVSKPSTTPNSRRGLGAPSSLGAIGPLGSVQNVGASGCIATAGPADSLGDSPQLGAPDGLGAPPSLNASPQLGSRSSSPGGLGASGALGSLGASQSRNGSSASAAAASGSALAGSNAGGALSSNPSGNDQNGDGSSSSSSSNSSSSLTGNWLVTLTGFHGSAVGAALGEKPDWIGHGLAGAPSANPNGGGVTGNDVNGNGVNGNGSNGGFGNPPTLGPGNPGTGAPGGNETPFPTPR